MTRILAAMAMGEQMNANVKITVHRWWRFKLTTGTHVFGIECRGFFRFVCIPVFGIYWWGRA